MKKILLTAMIAALLIVPLQGVALAETSETALPDATVSQEQDFIPGSVPAETGMAESMTPAIHAMILSMLHHDLTVYDPSDPNLGWETLYNMLSLYGQLDERSEYAGEDLILPVETVMDFSAALCSSFDSLGRLPSELADRIVYDAKLDSYRLACGSDDLAQIQLTSSRQVGNSMEISGTLVYLVDGTNLAQFRATLRPQDNMFGCTIVGLELL